MTLPYSLENTDLNFQYRFQKICLACFASTFLQRLAIRASNNNEYIRMFAPSAINFLLALSLLPVQNSLIFMTMPYTLGLAHFLLNAVCGKAFADKAIELII